jgi:hypothetical protein
MGIFNALQRVKPTADLSGIGAAASGKVSSNAPAKLDVGTELAAEQAQKAVDVTSEKAQSSEYAAADQLAGILADSHEQKAVMAQQKQQLDMDLDIRLNNMYKQYSSQWQSLDEKRKENMMESILLVNSLRNEDEMMKIKQEASKRQLDDEIKFKTAMATAQYSEFIESAKQSAVVRNYIYANTLRAREELAAIRGADAFRIAMSAMETQRIQGAWNSAAKAGEKLAGGITIKDAGASDSMMPSSKFKLGWKSGE